MYFIRRRRNFLKRGRSRESIDAGQLREFCSFFFGNGSFIKYSSQIDPDSFGRGMTRGALSFDLGSRFMAGAVADR